MFVLQNVTGGAVEMAHQLRAVAAFVEDLGLAASTHTVVYNHLK